MHPCVIFLKLRNHGYIPEHVIYITAFKDKKLTLIYVTAQKIDIRC